MPAVKPKALWRPIVWERGQKKWHWHITGIPGFGESVVIMGHAGESLGSVIDCARRKYHNLYGGQGQQ